MNAKETALRNDKRLLDMATYAITDGQTRLFNPHDLGEMDVLQDKFNYFKMLVRCGEATIEQLEEKVFSQWGAGTVQKRRIGFSTADDEELERAEREIFGDGDETSRVDETDYGKYLTRNGSQGEDPDRLRKN